MKKFDFIKMHGLGNDFVIIDERNGELGLSTAEIVSIANRHTGCLLYTSPSPRDRQKSRMPSSA